MAQNPAALMPLRNDRGAPTFDTSKTRELGRYFEDLEQLFLKVGYSSPAHDKEMKQFAVRYVDYDTEQLWRSFTEYADATPYSGFKDAILLNYPSASGDFVYSISDMDVLVGEKQRVGINTLSEMADYHMQFLSITKWLITKDLLSNLEQQRAYVRAFQPVLRNAVSNRLQLKHPDHYPNVPYKVEEVYDAARFVLQGSMAGGYHAPAAPALGSPSSPPQIKPEPTSNNDNLTALLTEFAKIMKDTLAANQNANRSNNGGRRPCFFCGIVHPGECADIPRYIKEGKCQKNQEGRIVLPNGYFVPREIQGENLKARIDEWHRRNPNQATAILINTIGAINEESPSKAEAYRLSTTERIAHLEAEIFNLRKKPAPRSNVQTRSQMARIEEVDEEEEAEKVRKEAQDKVQETPAVNKAPQKAPEHPYRNARDASYSPPVIRNVGAQDKPYTPAYKTLPPVHDPAIATRVYNRAMDAPITVTQRELLSLSPEIRSQVRDTITTKRVFNRDNAPKEQHLYQHGVFQDEEEKDYYQTLEGFAIPYTSRLSPPRDAFIIPDPMEMYLNSLKPDEDPDMNRLVVSCVSSSVRSINAIVDNRQKHECILDPGSQVIAMSEDICHKLSLPYDPSVRIRLISANGTFDYSLGLSRNVSFQVGSITVYLQIHIIRDPSYGILLGRPFDIVTQSVVRNFANADQTITIFDPNTGQRATIPTFARKRENRDEDF
jgi:murein DD-endopeptidase MepM/ murein hydrolase activator NlpD